MDRSLPVPVPGTLAASARAAGESPLAQPARQVPPRALALSVAALAVPVYASTYAPDSASQYEVFLWLLALVPAFLLSYYRGWRGAALALAVGMGLLAAVQVAVLLRGRPIENWPLLLVVVITYISVSLAIGCFSELLHRARERAERLALTDELTGLANRRHAQAVLQREFAAADRGRSLSIVLFDLDFFKQYNDRFGHAAGDEALRVFGQILQRNTRAMNLSARFGGEEFLSILSDTEVEGAVAFVERVQKGLREAQLASGSLTASAGVAVYAPGMRDAGELVGAADRALYRAKQAGRNRVSVHAPAQAAPGR